MASPKTLGRFAERQIGRDDHRGAFVELANEMEAREQIARASLSEGQIAEFVENGEVLASEVIGDSSSSPPLRVLRLQAIDEIDFVLKKRPRRPARMQLSREDGNGEMRLAGPGAPDENDVALLRDEAASR